MKKTILVLTAFALSLFADNFTTPVAQKAPAEPVVNAQPAPKESMVAADAKVQTAKEPKVIAKTHKKSKKTAKTAGKKTKKHVVKAKHGKKIAAKKHAKKAKHKKA